MQKLFEVIGKEGGKKKKRGVKWQNCINILKRDGQASNWTNSSSRCWFKIIAKEGLRDAIRVHIKKYE